MPIKEPEKLIRAFGLLSRAAARKKFYAQKAKLAGRPELSHLLRAMAESEAIQARRLFNAMRGQIDRSDRYVATIFEQEIEEMLAEYTELLAEAERNEDRVLVPILTELRAAEQHTLAFYARERKDARSTKAERYFACSFCGYLHLSAPPESCPVCGASQQAFREID